MGPRQDYRLYLVCPHCFRSQWVVKRSLALSREQLLEAEWEFECPVHGPLREKPLETSLHRELR